jgi:hypothetical protein
MLTPGVIAWSELSGIKLNSAVHRALKDWHKPDTGDSPFAGLRLYRNLCAHTGFIERQATNQLLHVALDELSKKHDEGAAILMRQFLNKEALRLIWRSLNIEEAEYHRRQKIARAMLAEIIHNQEIKARVDYRVKQVVRLGPVLEQTLIGVDQSLQAIYQLLVAAEQPWLIAIKGMGGIGKTALAYALVRRLIDADVYDAIAWVSAKTIMLTPRGHLKPIEQTVLTAETLLESLFEQLLPDIPKPEPFTKEVALAFLEQRLKAHPHLIVLDNLETVENVDNELLPLLRLLANPSKFLLTTRDALDTPTGVIAHITAPELNQYDAIRLVKQVAREADLRHVLAASNQELSPIYEVVGGNPLGLRLVTGLLDTSALDEVLTDLQQARGQPAEDLYAFLYRRAWERLDEQARLTLLAMPLLNERGGAFEALQHITQLPSGELRTSLRNLVALSLVESTGDLHRRFYSIHNLTRSWLQKHVLQWR